jgi:hypothetical protein
MKNLILILTVMVVSVMGVSAQDARSSQGKNEFYIGASALQENVDRAYTDGGLLVIDDSRKSLGFTVGYDHYLGGNKAQGKAGIFGVGAEFDMTFNRDGVALGSFTYNGTLKARNAKYVQPYVKLGAGLARADFGGSHFGNGVITGAESSEIFKGGVGVDFNTKAYSRYKIRTGVNYETTTFGHDRQHNVRGTVAIVF